MTNDQIETRYLLGHSRECFRIEGNEISWRFNGGMA